MVKFCIDRLVDGKPYPNVAQLDAKPYTAQWRQFSTTWPYSEPVHFFDYLDSHGIPYELVEWTQATRETFYPISVSYFDFDVQWFDLLPVMIKEKLRSKTLSLWFFYSEADDPNKIKQHLTQQAISASVDPALIQVVSANSAADITGGCHYFPDDEFLYQLRNIDPAVKFHKNRREKKFTALVRTHKWWRAATMARIWSDGYHDQGYFSYCKDLSTGEHWRESPVTILNFVGLFDKINHFLEHCPFSADSLNSQQHNLYSTTVIEHFDNSYINVILETHLDCDQTGGVFVTEKTFKPIKNAQPFIMFGAHGTITHLRNLGYRTFDHVIDHSYDEIENNTQRWNSAYQEFQRLMTVDLHQLYLDCEQDLKHNQDLFLSLKPQRLNTLLQQSTHYATNRKQLYQLATS